MSYSFLLLDDVHPSAVRYLEQNNHKVIHFQEHTKEKLLEIIENIDVIIYRLFTTTIDKEILNKAKKLKCIVRTGGGIGRIDYEIAKENNIVIMDTKNCNSFTAAEFIFGCILDLARNITLGDRVFRSGKFDRKKLWGIELAGKTLGIIGFGYIGKNLCRMANAFNMNVISYSPHITKDEETQYNMKGVTLDKLYIMSDFISIAFPADKSYFGMINNEKIDLMKNGVFIINATAMGLFEYEDVIKGLKDGKIGGIVIDRPSFDPATERHPFLDLPNVVFSPTLGSHTHEGQSRCVLQAIDQALNYIENNKIINQIMR
jgi:D-3-phosphoglycerate dehydrogenase